MARPRIIVDESKVIELAAKGLTQREIAVTLGISVDTPGPFVFLISIHVGWWRGESLNLKGFPTLTLNYEPDVAEPRISVKFEGWWKKVLNQR